MIIAVNSFKILLIEDNYLQKHSNLVLVYVGKVIRFLLQVFRLDRKCRL